MELLLRLRLTAPDSPVAGLADGAKELALRQGPDADPARTSLRAERARLVIGHWAEATAKSAQRSERRHGPGAEAHDGYQRRLVRITASGGASRSVRTR